MKRKSIAVISICILVVLVLVFFVFQANSKALALSSAGVDTSYIHEVVALDVNDGVEFQILYANMNDGTPALIRLEKNGLGFWSVKKLDTANEEGYAAMGWAKFSSTQRYTATDVPRTGHIYHHVYAGNNALKLIDIPQDQIPHNLTMDIQQNGKSYVIHIITTAETSDYPGFDIYGLLKDNGCIP